VQCYKILTITISLQINIDIILDSCQNNSPNCSKPHSVKWINVNIF